IMNSDQYQPLQLKGEIMDLEFTIDTDHRKRRRNRTTQSCLNCHTSKRKTGLCVYEIDDPALRDDPTIDETTRLRNRIAELESLVRELRGKPHPRWADANFRDGDPNEKWHSRASKCLPPSKRRISSPAPLSPELVEDHSTAPISIANGHGRTSHPHHPHNMSTLLTPIKTEAPSDPASHLYRFSASPGPPSSISNGAGGILQTYHGFPSDLHHSSPTSSPSTSVYEVHPGMTNGSGGSDGGDGVYSNDHFSNTASTTSAAATSRLPGSPNGSPTANTTNPYCPCRTSSGLAHTYISLAHQLQSSLNNVRSIMHNNGCVLYRKMVELD
ncbi:hypothetical protein K435DRAFT_614519, partial [Dendrothele bispora CBS 962.96]